MLDERPGLDAGRDKRRQSEARCAAEAEATLGDAKAGLADCTTGKIATEGAADEPVQHQVVVGQRVFADAVARRPQHVRVFLSRCHRGGPK